ncbi:MAG: hypothetical protein ABEL51_04630 [Salinibacter sp.]
MILRTQKDRDHPFVILDKTGLDDPRLSWKAKGLLAYLISKPDDWQVRLHELINASTDGRDATKSGLAELDECGYFKRVQRQDPATGEWCEQETHVYENPQIEDDSPQTENPSTDNPSTGDPSTENPSLPINEGLSNNGTKTSPVGSSTPADPATNGDNPQGQTAELIEDVGAKDGKVGDPPPRSKLPMKGPKYVYPQSFERFWTRYPRNVDKAAAYDEWRRKVRHGHDAELIERGAEAYQAHMDDEDREVGKIKHPRTWLYNDGWMDYLDEDGNFVGYQPQHDDTDIHQILREEAAAELNGAAQGGAE